VRRRSILQVLGCSVVLGAFATPAQGGVYDVWGCRLPTGESSSAEGWTSSSSGSAYIANWCINGPPGDNSLHAELPAGATTYLSAASWTFEAPPNTTIANYTLRRWAQSGAGDAFSMRSYWLFHDQAVFGASDVGELCMVYWQGCVSLGSPTGDVLADSNAISASGLNIRRLIMWLGCGEGPNNTATCAAAYPPGIFSLYQSRIGLDDPRPPVLTSSPTGSLLDPSVPLEGEKQVTVAATDAGGGLAKVGVVVDGALRAEQSFDAALVKCREPYLAPVPCPTADETTFSFDTAGVPNGAHVVQIAVTDVGQNRTLSSPVTVTTRNGNRPNGVGASRQARISASFGRRRSQRVKTVGYGASATLRGELTNVAGDDIVGAIVSIESRVTRRGSAWRLAGTATTDRRGRFAFRPTVGPTRSLRIAYRAQTLDDQPSAVAEARLQVRAGVRLTVRPKRVTSRGRIVFSGGLRGGPGRPDTQVAIYAVGRRGREKVPVTILRADRKGHFRFAYRFRRSFAPFTYRFQAVVRRQQGYPYVTGSSPAVAVHIVR
jgi:hypothetical protein